MRPSRSDAGFTVVELVITVSLVMLVTVALLSFLDNTTSITNRAGNDVRAEQAAQNALRTVTEDIRSARLVSACASPNTFANCITVEIAKSTSASNLCPKEIVVYSVTGSTLTQNLTDYASNCTTITRTRTQKLMTTLTSTSVFTYYGSNGITVLNPAVSADLALIPKATAVRIQLNVRYQPNTPILTLSSVATLRNNRTTT